jgi:hypothetical protein
MRWNIPLCDAAGSRHSGRHGRLCHLVLARDLHLPEQPLCRHSQFARYTAGADVAARAICQRLHCALVLFKKSRRYLPRSAFGQAIDYALSNWPLLGVLEPNPNRQQPRGKLHPAYRSWKENWLFLGDADAGQRSAILYTIFESCRCRSIDLRLPA